MSIHTAVVQTPCQIVCGIQPLHRSRFRSSPAHRHLLRRLDLGSHCRRRMCWGSRRALGNLGENGALGGFSFGRFLFKHVVLKSISRTCVTMFEAPPFLQFTPVSSQPHRTVDYAEKEDRSHARLHWRGRRGRLCIVEGHPNRVFTAHLRR